MAQITWQNVNAPSNADVFRGMALAAANINDGAANLGQMGNTLLKLNQDKMDQSDAAKALQVKAALVNAQNPEQYQAALGLGTQLTSQFNDPKAAGALLSSLPAAYKDQRENQYLGNTATRTDQISGIKHPSAVSDTKDIVNLTEQYRPQSQELATLAKDNFFTVKKGEEELIRDQAASMLDNKRQHGLYDLHLDRQTVAQDFGNLDYKVTSKAHADRAQFLQTDALANSFTDNADLYQEAVNKENVGKIRSALQSGTVTDYFAAPPFTNAMITGKEADMTSSAKVAAFGRQEKEVTAQNSLNKVQGQQATDDMATFDASYARVKSAAQDASAFMGSMANTEATLKAISSLNINDVAKKSIEASAAKILHEASQQNSITDSEGNVLPLGPVPTSVFTNIAASLGHDASFFGLKEYDQTEAFRTAFTTWASSPAGQEMMSQNGIQKRHYMSKQLEAEDAHKYLLNQNPTFQKIQQLNEEADKAAKKPKEIANTPSSNSSNSTSTADAEKALKEAKAAKKAAHRAEALRYSNFINQINSSR